MPALIILEWMRHLHRLFDTRPRQKNIRIDLLLRQPKRRALLVREHARDIFPHLRVYRVGRLDDIIHHAVRAAGRVVGVAHAVQPCHESVYACDGVFVRGFEVRTA